MLVYEPQYRIIGWADDSGKARIAWFDRDLADPIIQQTTFFSDPDTFPVATVALTALASTFIDPDSFFTPKLSIITSDAREMLKNEVRRTRFLTGPGGAMYVGKDYSPSAPDEVNALGLDFVNDLDAGETLQSAVWSFTVLRGTDPNPASHLFGPPRLVTPDGSTLQTATVQGFGSLLPEVLYAVRAVATTSQGKIIPLHSHIYVEGIGL